MATLVSELFGGGLVTSRDPALLEPGELTIAKNGVYLPYNDALHRSAGQFLMGSIVSSAAINGLLSCKFNSGNHYLVAQTNAKLYTADAESDTPSFTSAANVTEGATIKAAHFKNRYYLFNGSNQNLVLRDGVSIRPHGLSSVPGFNSTAGSTASGADFTLSPSTGYVEYWYTELYRSPTDADDEVESAYGGDPLSVAVTASTGTYPQVVLPLNPTNPHATHFRVYRSANLKATLNEEVLFPVGDLVGEFAIESSSTASHVFKDKLTVSDSGNAVFQSVDTPDWTVSTALYVDDGTASVVTKPVLPNGTEYFTYANVYNSSALGTLTGSVKGITVTVKAKASHPQYSKLTAVLGVRTQANYFYNLNLTQNLFLGNLPTLAASGRSVSLSTAYTTATLGSSSTLWGGYGAGALGQGSSPPGSRPWATGDFGATFCILLIAHISKDAVSGATIEVDHVSYKVHYDGVPDAGLAYPIIETTLNGEVAFVQRNGPPPVATVGALFEGALVTDDISKPGVLRHSDPGKPDVFPEPYFIPMQETNDAFTCLETVRGRMVAATPSAFYLVKYLPNELDEKVLSSRSYELVSSEYGVVHRSLYAVFTGPENRPEIAFVSHNGVFSTDGYAFRNIGLDLIWIGPGGVIEELDASISSKAKALINDPSTQLLHLLLANGTEYTASYAARHRKPSSGVKWSGPTHLTVRVSTATAAPVCAAVVRRANGGTVVVYGYSAQASVGGSLYRKDAADLPSTASKSPILDQNNNKLIVQTRDMYLAGMGSEFEADSLFVYGRDYTANGYDTSAPESDIEVTKLYCGGDEASVAVESQPNTSSAKLLKFDLDKVQANALRIKLTQSSTTPIEYHKAILRVSSFGDVDGED